MTDIYTVELQGGCGAQSAASASLASAAAEAARDISVSAAGTSTENAAVAVAAATSTAERAAYFAGLMSTSPLAELDVPAETIGGVFPEQFGALGNGTTNDTAAFQALAAFINAGSGGTIILRPGANYLVGKQDLVNDGSYMFKGQPVLTITGCVKPIKIVGNGAKFTLAPGLKFGTFNADGTPAGDYAPGKLSSPVEQAVVFIQYCSGRITIEPFEIDGNRSHIVLGGQYGDIGWQVPGDGLFLAYNTGGETVGPVYAHDCPRDNIQIIGGGAPITRASPMSGSLFVGFRGLRAGRNGMSFLAGRGYTFIGCVWGQAGSEGGAYGSPPSACVDLEAEIGAIRDLRFIGCDFNMSGGCAFVADSGDTARVSFQQCRFINAQSWAAWLAKPYFSFDECLFAGAMNCVWGALKEAEMPRFRGCAFTDDDAYLPVGATFAAGTSLFNGGLKDALFDRCSFRAMYNCGAGGNGGGVFRDCSFDLGAGAGLGGIFGMNLRGRNEFSAATPFGLFLTEDELGGISGEVIYNGTVCRSGSKVYNPPSVAAGAFFTTTITVPLARYWDTVRVHFASPTLGISFAESYVSGAGSEAGLNGEVTVIGRNNTGAAIDLPSGTLTAAVQGIRT